MLLQGMGAEIMGYPPPYTADQLSLRGREISWKGEKIKKRRLGNGINV